MPAATADRALTTAALTTAQKTRIRTRLIADLEGARTLEERLQKNIADGIESRRGSSGDEIDDPEGASTAFEGAQATAMLGQTRKHAEEISAALARIADGTYGSCSRCGNAIAKGRLEARPSTEFCISCAA